MYRHFACMYNFKSHGYRTSDNVISFISFKKRQTMTFMCFCCVPSLSHGYADILSRRFVDIEKSRKCYSIFGLVDYCCTWMREFGVKGLIYIIHEISAIPNRLRSQFKYTCRLYQWISMINWIARSIYYISSLLHTPKIHSAMLLHTLWTQCKIYLLCQICYRQQRQKCWLSLNDVASQRSALFCQIFKGGLVRRCIFINGKWVFPHENFVSIQWTVN